MGARLKNPPVYVTVAQVRFNPILKIAEFLPSIQERFRLAGYPDFKTQHGVSIQISVDNNETTPKPVKQEIYRFGNVEQTDAFTLDNQNLTLLSTNYGDFKQFQATFIKGLEATNELLDISYVERVGLRYLDRVMPLEGDKLEDYLISQVHGINSLFGGVAGYTYTEALNVVGSIKLVSRIAIQKGPLAFPPDLQIGNDMQVIERFKTYDGISAILDNDGFIEGREPFSKKQIIEHLENIHKVIGNAFKAIVTPYAFESWDK